MSFERLLKVRRTVNGSPTPAIARSVELTTRFPLASLTARLDRSLIGIRSIGYHGWSPRYFGSQSTRRYGALDCASVAKWSVLFWFSVGSLMRTPLFAAVPSSHCFVSPLTPNTSQTGVALFAN